MKPQQATDLPRPTSVAPKARVPREPMFPPGWGHDMPCPYVPVIPPRRDCLSNQSLPQIAQKWPIAVSHQYGVWTSPITSFLCELGENGSDFSNSRGFGVTSRFVFTCPLPCRSPPLSSRGKTPFLALIAELLLKAFRRRLPRLPRLLFLPCPVRHKSGSRR